MDNAHMVSYSSKYDFETVKNLTEMESNCDGVAINLEFQTLTKVQVTYGIYTLTPVLTCADQTWDNACFSFFVTLIMPVIQFYCHNTLHFNVITNLQLNCNLKQYIFWNSGFWKWIFSCISENVEYIHVIIQLITCTCF